MNDGSFGPVLKPPGQPFAISLRQGSGPPDLEDTAGSGLTVCLSWGGWEVALLLLLHSSL